MNRPRWSKWVPPGRPHGHWENTRWLGVEQWQDESAQPVSHGTGRALWLVLGRQQAGTALPMVQDWQGRGMTVYRSAPPARSGAVSDDWVDEGFLHQQRPVLMVAEQLLGQIPTGVWRQLSALVVLGEQSRHETAPVQDLTAVARRWHMPVLVLLPEQGRWHDWPMVLADRVCGGNGDVGLEAVHQTSLNDSPALWALVADWWQARSVR